MQELPARALEWLLGLSTTCAVVVVVGGCIVFAMAMLLVIHRIVPHGLRTRHNDVAGFTLAIVGVIYAVFLAFIAVAIWEDYGRAAALTQTEASLVSDIHRDTVSLQPPLADEIRRGVATYAQTVVELEWPDLAMGQPDEAAGWQALERIHASLAKDHPADPVAALVEANMIQTLNGVYDARRGRYGIAAEELPPIVWWNLVAGGAIVILFCCLFGTPNLRMHIAMLSMLASSIGLVLALILLLNSPFRGRNHVSAEPFNRLAVSVGVESAQ